MPVIDFTPTVQPGKFDAQVKEELDALVAAGEGKATQVVVKTVDANIFRVAFAKAANAIDKTARLQSATADGKLSKPDAEGKQVPTGDTTLVFTLTAKHAPRRGKIETPAEAE